MSAKNPRIVARRSVFRGWNSVEVVTVEAADADGKRHRVEREVIDHGEASVVLPIDCARAVAILVRQLRVPMLVAGVDPHLLEACAGIIDPGETPEGAARREAEEETGLKLGALRKVGSVVASAGTLTERMHLFIAEISAGELTKERRGNAHEGEHIEVVELPLPELYAMARRGEIEDAKTLVIVQRLMLESAER